MAVGDIGPEYTAGRKYVRVPTPLMATSDATDEWVLFHNDFGFSVSLTSVKYVQNGAYTGADTNYRSIEIVNRGTDGTGTTELGNWDGDSGNNLTDSVPQAVVTTAATIANGESVNVTRTEVGTGLGLGNGMFILEFE